MVVKDLSVSVISDRDQSEIELTEDPKEKSLLNVMSFADVQEWKLHDGCTTWKEFKQESFNSSNKIHPTFGASCKVSRRPQFFIWNFFAIMSYQPNTPIQTLICSLSFTTFTVSVTFPHTRLQLTFILLLTTVSFKFMTNQNLPTVTYFTYLDIYILGLMSILITICVWHAVIFFTYHLTKCDDDLVNFVDDVACGVFLGIYAVFHFAYYFSVACVMTFDENCTDDYHMPGQDVNEQGSAQIVNDSIDNNQAVIVACGMD